MGSAPVSLNVEKFVQARVPEIEAFHALIQKISLQRISNSNSNSDESSKRKRKREENHDIDDEKIRDLIVPPGQRRRTNSYLPRKGNLRAKKKSRFTKKKNEKENDVKKLSRRARRRIEFQKGGIGGFGCSGDGTKRLVTHLWHAKRFKMVKKWGFHLPYCLFGKGKGSRAVLKRAESGALLHDASYYSAMLLEGSEGSLLNVLRRVLEPSPLTLDSMSKIQRDELNGSRYVTAMLNTFEGSQCHVIAPIMYIWCPCPDGATNRMTDESANSQKTLNDNETRNGHRKRMLWIWIHAAAFEDGVAVIQNACTNESEEAGACVQFLTRAGDLGRLDIFGSNALKLLQRVLYPVSQNSEYLGMHESAGVVPSEMAEATGSHFLEDLERLPNFSALFLDVYDPRDTPLKQDKHLSQGTFLSQNSKTHQTVEKSDGFNQGASQILLNTQIMEENKKDKTTSSSQTNPVSHVTQDDYNLQYGNLMEPLKKSLWDVRQEGAFYDPPMSEYLLSEKRRLHRLSILGLQSASLKENEKSFSGSCPIVLLKAEYKIHSASGWSIILPLSWLKAFWVPLIMEGAKVIGLKERRWLISNAGLPSFPYDFPDGQAYTTHNTEQTLAFDEEIGTESALKMSQIPYPWPEIGGCFCCHLNKSFSSHLTKQSGQISSQNSLTIVSEKPASNQFCSAEYATSLFDGSSFPSTSADSFFPGIIIRTSTSLKNYLREIGGHHLLLFPQMSISGRKSFSQLTEEGRIAWKVKSMDRFSARQTPLFLRVTLYAPGKGSFEEGALVCAPLEDDFISWLSRPQGWKGLEISPSLVNKELSQCWTIHKKIAESLETNSVTADTNLRMPIGLVTTGVCQGSSRALAVAFCEGSILGKLRAEQWKERKWRERFEIFVLVRNARSNVYRPALAFIVLEQHEDTLFW